MKRKLRPDLLPTIAAAYPLKPPNWRWRRMQEAAIGDVQLSRDDDWLLRAYSFWTDYNNTDISDEQLYAEHTDVAISYDLYRRGVDDGPQNLKWALEALIMAAEPPESIAEMISTTTPIIVAYEKLFFDVRPRLMKKIYVAQHLLGSFCTSGVLVTDFDAFWKALAYFGGTKVLLAWWSFLGADADVQATLDEMNRHVFFKQAFGAKLRLEENATLAVESEMKLRLAAKLSSPSGGSTVVNQQMMHDLLAAIGTPVRNTVIDSKPEKVENRLRLSEEFNQTMREMIDDRVSNKSAELPKQTTFRPSH